jgi:AcrR family transcriptional regulator
MIEMVRSTSASLFFVSQDDAPSKQEILKAALSLFVRDGLCETSIRDIAERSGYSNPVLYKFYAGKDDLALHLFVACYRQLYARINGAIQAQSTFDLKFDAMIEAFSRMSDENNDAILYVNDHLRTFWPKLSATQRKQSFVGLVRELIGAGASEGRVRPWPDLTVPVAIILGSLTQVARFRYFGEIDSKSAATAWSTLRTSLRAALALQACGQKA